MNTARNFLLVCFALGCVPSAGVAETILFESAALGRIGITAEELLSQAVPGSNVNEFVFVGARFELMEPVVTSRIGGHFASLGVTDNWFFGAIVDLSGPTDFPDSGDLSSPDVLGDTLLTFPEPSAEVFGELQLALKPGWYGVVFGSGLFGAAGAGGVVENGTDFASTRYLSGFNGGWGNGLGILGSTYSVFGQIVPEPRTSALLGVCIALAFGLSKRFILKSSHRQ